MLPGKREVLAVEAYFDYLSAPGGSIEMDVDGSVSPVRFEYRFPATNRHFRILDAVLSISSGKLDDPAFFGGLSAALTNGVQVGWIVSLNGVETDFPTLISFKSNFDIVSFAAESKPWGFTKDDKDVMVAEFFKDFEPTIDPKQVVALYLDVRDDLTSVTAMRMAVRGYTT